MPLSTTITADTDGNEKHMIVTEPLHAHSGATILMLSKRRCQTRTLNSFVQLRKTQNI